jgi:hypothetical protein
VQRVHTARKLSAEEMEKRLRASSSSKVSREKRESALQRTVIDEWGWRGMTPPSDKELWRRKLKEQQLDKAVDEVLAGTEYSEASGRPKDAKSQESKEWVRQVAEVRARAAAAAKAHFEAQ